MSLRVLIPSCTDDLLGACFASMQSMELFSPAAVIVGDNGLSAGFPKYRYGASYVAVSKPFVYSAAINACAEASKPGDDFLIMGDDTAILSPNWLSMCEALLADWPKEYGLLNLCEPHKSAIGEAATVLAFVGTLIPRRVWDELGPMDTRYTGYGYDDFDYCLRLLHAGYRIGVTAAAMIHHTGSASYGPSPDFSSNRERFEEKWGLTVGLGFIRAAPHFKRQECHCASIGT